jgi:hypothetical protein
MQDEMSSRSRDPVTGAGISTPPRSDRGAAPGAAGAEAWRNIWEERGDVRLFGVGTGTLVALGSSIAAAWWLVRWRRERNRPINRLRHLARSTARQFGERLVEGELVGLVQGDAVIAAEIGGAAQPAHQVMGEIRAADAVRFLRRLVGGAGGQIGVTLDPSRFVE